MWLRIEPERIPWIDRETRSGFETGVEGHLKVKLTWGRMPRVEEEQVEES